MTVISVVLAGFMFMYLSLNRSGQGTTQLTASQSSTRTVVRVLEADVRSADPLEVPSSAQNITAGTFPGTADTDYIAMFESADPFSPCKTTPTPPSVPSGSLPMVVLQAPNVVWSYSPATGRLTRWSYVDCGSGAKWYAGMYLGNVVDPAGTAFLVLGAGTQITTGVTGQAALPLCASGVKVRIQTATKGQTTAFKLDVTLPLPNEQSVEAPACK
jgi:hypothetical protein